MEPMVTGQKYNKIADWWNEKHCQSEYGMPQIKRAVKYCTNKHFVLDVGCGSGGRVINYLAENGFNVTGIDVSSRMIELAKANHPNTQIHFGDITNWKTDKKFDLIIAWDSIFHLPSSKQTTAIDNMCSMLNQDGVIIYTFGDGNGDHEDKSFDDGNGGQFGDLNNDFFGYGSIGISNNLNVLMKNKCKIMHLECDQYPQGHVYIIGKKEV